MNTRNVHPLVAPFIEAASTNDFSQLKRIIQAIPTFSKIRTQELKAYNELHLENLANEEFSIDSKDIDNNTALLMAAENGHSGIVSELISAKANPNVISFNGSTALIHAAMQGHTYIVKQLIEAKADLNIQNDKRDTALVDAAYYNYLETVKLLIEEKADINIRCSEGRTALMWAIASKRTAIAEYLLENTNAKIKFLDSYDQSALDLAIKNFEPQIIELLLKKGAVVNNPEKLLYHLEGYDQRQPATLRILTLLFQDQVDTIDMKLNRPHLQEEQLRKLYQQIQFLKTSLNEYRSITIEILDQATMQTIPLSVLNMIADYDNGLEHSAVNLYYVEEEKRRGCVMQ